MSTEVNANSVGNLEANIEIIQHDLALLAHIVSRLAHGFELDGYARAAEKMRDFYEEAVT